MIQHQGELAALGTAFCWTLTALSFEAAGRRVGSLPVNLIRLILAGVFLTIFCTIARGQPLPLDAGPEAWFWLSLSGVIGFLIGDLCLFRALVIIGPRLSTLIMSLAPIVAALLGWILIGEVLSLVDLGGMALTLCGVTWVVLERSPKGDGQPREGRPAHGILLALIGAIGQGGGLVLSAKGLETFKHPFAATQIRVIVGVIGFSVLFLFIKRWPHVIKALSNFSAMKFIGTGAFFGPFLGVSLSLMAVQYIAAGVAQTIMSILPILIIPFVIVIYKEKVSPRAVLGALMAVAGVGILFTA